MEKPSCVKLKEMAKILAIDDNQDNLISVSAILRNMIPEECDNGPVRCKRY